MSTQISDQQWAQFEEAGFLHLGNVMDNGELEQLQVRMDDIMLGKASIDYDRVMMQLDRDPERDNKPGPQSKGHKGETLLYRKIQDLERDALFLDYLQKPIFRSVCARAYGNETPVACFRAMFMNKPARGGTELVWHQDRWTDLDKDPMITIWTALDPAIIANGCVKLIPGSHRALINPEHGAGFLTEEHIENIVSKQEFINLELEPGDCVVLHNWTLHSSGTNSTDIARRAFSVCYMDAATQSSRGHEYAVVFGEGEMTTESIA
ncbi:MAG: phytanoyl-CoA dioxygenase family protein [Candidatus Latescibacteria bacterium]|nr:phytanoyl-CoA dioxygenase family protein [Candidatus Latescibacterota bacterium]